MIFECDNPAAKPEIKVGNVVLGGNRLVLIAGPCTVESRSQLLETAIAAKEGGASILRGGAYKPRTSPSSFQGLREHGLELLAEAREITGMPIVTEVLDTTQLETVAAVADMLQIGSRNMGNSVLLQKAGAMGKPVLLKRGMCSTVNEFLLAAEYVLEAGCRDLVLCERGIRTFETATRFTLDLNAVPLLKRQTWLPVVVDPSHGTGREELVSPMARAAVACGADGVMVELHPCPADALCDGPQCLTPEKFHDLVKGLRLMASAIGRSV